MPDSRFRTITQEKKYHPYELSANVKIDYSFPSEDPIQCVLTFKGLWETYFDNESFPNMFIVPYTKYPVHTIVRRVTDLLPPSMFDLDFEIDIKNVVMHIYKSTALHGFDSKEEAEDALRQLNDNNLIFSGYLYESAYHQHLIFYEYNTAQITFDYWSGEWVNKKDNNRRKKSYDPR